MFFDSFPPTGVLGVDIYINNIQLTIQLNHTEMNILPGSSDPPPRPK
jgi:hypothetical protein